MISLTSQITESRQQYVMGWYHSHPFDLAKDSHCFLSATDVATELRWQLSEDQAGNPFVALVIDPQRSNFFKVPVIEAFRAYRPEHKERNSELIAPDGKRHENKDSIIQRWGESYRRYYTFPVQIYSSELNRQLLKSMTEKFLWMRNFCLTQQMDNQSQDRFVERIMNVESKLKVFNDENNITDAKSRTLLPSVQNNSHGLSEDYLKIKATEKVKEYIFNEKL